MMSSRELSRLITELHVEKILVATYNEPKSARELSDKYDIPIAAAYRKIHQLERAGLLKCVKVVIGRDGKKVKLYKSMLERAYLYFENGKFRARFELSTGE